MADQLYLSYWLRGVTPLNLLHQFEKVLEIFPYSQLAPFDAVLRLHAVSYSEPVLLETPIPSPVDADAVVKIAAEFQNADVAHELATAWDLWRKEKEWKLAASGVTIACFAPDFDRDPDEHLRINFGLETQFLPPEDDDGGIPMVRANLRSLLRLVHDLDARLPVERRQLWSDSGENFAAKLGLAIGAGEREI